VSECVVLRLVEKLADGEATAEERIVAEEHLPTCPGCRGHLEFLVSVAGRAPALPLPEPPESYWEHLPRRVLDRIDAEEWRPSRVWRFLPATPLLRWGVLGAALVAAAAVSLSVLREESRTPPASGPAPARVVASPEAQTPSPLEPAPSPPMARDEAAPAAAERESLPEVEKLEPSPKPSPAPAALPPADSVVVEPPEEYEAREPSVAVGNMRVREQAESPGAATAALASRMVREDCGAFRREVEAFPARSAEPGASDARFELALCSLQLYEREGTQELRALAVEDAESFLAGESEGVRAERIREELRRLQLIQPY
jgi:hypothetical protein